MKIILLDIDGVLAPLGKVEDDFIIVDLDGWSTIAIPNENIEFLKYINENVNIFWSSSWENISNNICKLINMKFLDYLCIGNDYHEIWNKLPAMIEFIEGNPINEILIVDDEIDTNSKNILCNYKNVKVFQVNPISGLTTKDKKSICKWINK